MYKNEQLPEKIIEEFVSRSESILGGNLVGVYLHGSSVMGCYNPMKSDLDFLVVVNEHGGFT